MVHTSTSSSFVQDAASVAASRFQEVVTHMQKPETRSQIQAKVDYVVKTLFAPCVGGVGGVPFEEMGEDGKKYYPDGIPMEVTPNTSEESMNAPRAKQQQPFTFGPAYPESNKIGRQENSLQKLRKLGARHQLAQGYIDPTLPDVARPVSPEEKYAVPCTDIGNEVIDDEVDFDDGISAISSHTLEEMEKKRNALTVRVNPTEFSKKERLPPSNTDFSKKAIMEAMSGETEDDDFFGEPFFNQPTKLEQPAKLERVELSNVTSDSNQLEKAWNVDEANYWKDEVSKDNDKRSSRQKQRLSVEERAKRLRELSRSRSRSSGTGSNGHHPHETSALVNQIREKLSQERGDVPMEMFETGEI